MTRKEKAMQSFLDGYNCSQCMMLAFEDLLTIDLDTMNTIKIVHVLPKLVALQRFSNST